MRKNLTVAAIDRVRRPKSGRIELLDAIVPGLVLRVTSNGAKSWAIRYRIDGRQKRHTLGGYPLVPLDEAREQAREAYKLLHKGVDPAAEAKAERSRRAAERQIVEAGGYPQGSFGAAAETYIERKLPALRRGWEVEAIIRRELLPTWGHRPMAEISRANIHELLDKLVDAGKPAAANRLFEIIRQVYNWSIGRGLVEHSPASQVQPPAPKVVRERVLSDDEIKAVWNASETLGHPFCPIVRLLLLTGQRREEVAGMAWSEIDLERKVWTIPAERAKSKRAHVVPLSDWAVEILETVPRRPRQDLLFPTSSKRGGDEPRPVSGFSKAKIRLDELSGTSDWRLHDLRRTARTGLARIKVAPHVAELVLNHARKGVWGTYDQAEYLDEKTDALRRWAGHLRRVVAGDAAKNVVTLHG